jgi:hypothetical protein
MQLRPGDLIIVHWRDAVDIAGWTEDAVAQIFQSTICMTIGWFLNEDKIDLRLFNSISGDGDKGIEIIPKGMIQRIQKIKYKRIGEKLYATVTGQKEHRS